MCTSNFVRVTAALGAISLWPVASAIGQGAETADAGWSWTVTPYFMAPTMSGTVGIGPVDANVEADAADIFDKLQFGAMLNIEARKGPWAIAFDGIYMDLEQDAANADLTAGADQGAFELAVFHRLAAWSEVLVGGRLNILGSSLDGEVLGSPVDENVDETWFDPVVGVRFTLPEAGRWDLSLRSDIGGFGVGSDLTLQVLPIVGYRLSSTVTLAMGYRFISVDYENVDKDFVYDMDTYGPDVRLKLAF